MSNKKVILKNKKGDLLSPETQWECILNTPPFSMGENNTVSCTTPKRVTISTIRTSEKKNPNLSIGAMSLNLSADKNVYLVSDSGKTTISDSVSGEEVFLSDYPKSAESLLKVINNSFAFGIVKATKEAAYPNDKVEYPGIRTKAIVSMPNPGGLPTLVTAYQTYYINSDGNIVKMGSSNMEFIPAIG